MTCPECFDLLLTDSAGESHGLICDWSRGGAGLHIEKGSDLSRSSATSTKGDYGVRDVDDHWRIIQTDWSLGNGQETYDREVDSESAFKDSRFIDIDVDGELRLVKEMGYSSKPTTVPAVIEAGKWGDERSVIWGSFAEASAGERIRYSYDALTWTALHGGTTPPAPPTRFCSDGNASIYAICDGIVHKVEQYNGAIPAGGPDNHSFTHLAFTSGYLYAAKGYPVQYTAQLGYFDKAAWPDSNWLPMSPPAGVSINATGAPFGLVTFGNYVYWGVVDNAGHSRIYKAMHTDVTGGEVFQEICNLPTGFHGSCMYSYLGTIYIGGSFIGSSKSVGIGAIYALVDDRPSLLTDVGTDDTQDNRVVTMTAAERSLYFVANAQIWRWDIVKGGYSHYQGSLNPTPVAWTSGGYTTMNWQGQWDMSAVPSQSTATKASAYGDSLGGGIADGIFWATIGLNSNNALRLWVSDANSAASGTNLIDDNVGWTMECKIPSSFMRKDGLSTNNSFRFGMHGSASIAYVRIFNWSGLDPNYYSVGLYSGPNHDNSDSLIGTSWIPKASAHTMRLILKGTYATVYDGDTPLISGTTNSPCSGLDPMGPSRAKQTFFKFQCADQNSWGQYFGVDDIRWSTDGSYDSQSSWQSSASGVQVAFLGRQLVAAVSGVGYVSTYPDRYKLSPLGTTPPFLLSSRSSGNMPTVDKFFQALHVNLSEVLPPGCSVGAVAVIDGKRRVLFEDTSDGDANLLVFPIESAGRTIQYELSLTTTNYSYTPKVTEVAVLFDPTPKTSRVHTYFVRCWDGLQDRLGGDWQETAHIVSDWLEETASTVVTVERPDGSEYIGRLEAIDQLEAPPSGDSRGKEGLFQLQVRRLRKIS